MFAYVYKICSIINAPYVTKIKSEVTITLNVAHLFRYSTLFFDGYCTVRFNATDACKTYDTIGVYTTVFLKMNSWV